MSEETGTVDPEMIRLRQELEQVRISVDRRIDNLIVRVKALESAVTLTDMGWATAEPEPSLPSPWQPMETCPEGMGDAKWYASTGEMVTRYFASWRKNDRENGRVAWCSATDHPEAPPHPDVLGKVEPSGPQPTVVDWQPIETVPKTVPVLMLRGEGASVNEVYVNEIYDVEHFLSKDKTRTRPSTHWAPLPAPPTEPAPSPTVPRPCWICGATDGNHVGLTEPAPEASTAADLSVVGEGQARIGGKVVRLERPTWHDGNTFLMTPDDTEAMFWHLGYRDRGDAPLYVAIPTDEGDEG